MLDTFTILGEIRFYTLNLLTGQQKVVIGTSLGCHTKAENDQRMPS